MGRDCASHLLELLQLSMKYRRSGQEIEIQIEKNQERKRWDTLEGDDLSMLRKINPDRGHPLKGELPARGTHLVGSLMMLGNILMERCQGVDVLHSIALPCLAP